MTVPAVTGWLKISQAAREAQVSAKTLRREIAAGRLIASRVGKCVRIRPANLERWMEERDVRQAS